MKPCEKATQTYNLINSGDSVNAKIFANCKWNDTGVILRENETYIFQTYGGWKDLSINTDATGYTSNDDRVPWYSWLALNLTDRFKRFPMSNWFSLIGCIGDEENCFDIGKMIKYTQNNAIYKATKTGKLYCYANDVSFAYGNNSGFLNLIITKQ